MSDKFISFVVCPKYHKLYKEDEVTDFQRDDQVSIMKCTHIEFPNMMIVRKRKICSTNLSTQSKLLNRAIVNHSELIFLFSPIQQQLANIYKHLGFESNLRHWVSRLSFNNTSILTDIYDGDIWKKFKDEPFAEDLELFFSKDNADSHLGLIVNLDWF